MGLKCPSLSPMRSLYRHVVSRLRDRDSEWKDAAEFAGVHRKTVARIMDGTVENPGVLTMEKLAEWVKKNPRRAVQ